MRVVCEGRFDLPVAPADALSLFTPEGERAWAGPAWKPVYPDSGVSKDDSVAGTVFTTESHGGDATWVVVERTEVGDPLRHPRRRRRDHNRRETPERTRRRRLLR